MMKKLFSLLLAILFLCSALVSCGKEDGKAQMLSFSQAQSISEMQKLDGKQVSIIGYMSTMSPVSGAFMYLMNLPYQSCPFCIPNTTQLSNTIAVYAKDQDGFEFTDRAIQVTGVLEFGDYTDEFGYEYQYRIKDATYTVLDTSHMTEELKLWQQLASTDVIAEIYTMFDYVNFLCYWPTYTTTYTAGKHYLTPEAALMFVEQDSAQFNYGYKDGYFDGIIATVQSVNPTAFAELVAIVEDAEALSQKAYAELKNGNCKEVAEYSDVFKDGRTQYQIDLASELEAEMEAIYTEFSHWLSNWEI